MSAPTLEVRNLRTHFFTRGGVVKAVDDVSFTVEAGKVMGLVGESGSGKTVTGFSIIGLVDPPGRIAGGQILFKGRDLATLPEAEMRGLRGNRIAMIFQDPMMTLNPVLRIDTQMIETVQAHEKVSREEARQRARDALGQVGIPSPDERLKAYPHQFSGGMRQRVAIAIALLHKPDVIVADEPTTALDVTIQGQILAEVLDAPLHPYTLGLIGSVPSRNKRGEALRQIPGMTPSLLNLPAGCAFRSRCPRAEPGCAEPPPMAEYRPGQHARCIHPHQEAVAA